VFLPGTQVGADTTDLSVFGVPLKLVGVQDIGGRDRSLFDSVVIDTRFVELYRRYPVQILRSAEASLCNRFLMRGAPDVRAVDRYFAALVRNHFVEHRARRATRDASRTLQERLSQQLHEADHVERARAADPALWLRQALDLIALQWLPADHRLLFDVLLRRHGPAATHDIAAGVLGQFRLASLPALGDDGVHAVALLLERELAQAHTRHQSDLAHDPECAMPRAIGLSTRSPPPNPLPN
jgi:hypothetical protein